MPNYVDSTHYFYTKIGFVWGRDLFKYSDREHTFDITIMSTYLQVTYIWRFSEDPRI